MMKMEGKPTWENAKVREERKWEWHLRVTAGRAGRQILYCSQQRAEVNHLQYLLT